MEIIDISHESGRLEPLSDLEEGETWAMVESSPDGMILADEHGVIALVNYQIEVLFGYDRGELLGRPVEELLPERHRQIHTAHRTRYRAKPKARAMGGNLDLMARRKDGTEFPVEVSLSPVTTNRGLRVVATVRDISDRLAAEAHSHAVLHTIDAAHDGVFMFEPDTLRFSYINRGAESQLGYRRDELLAMSPLHIKPEFTEASFRDLIQPLLEGAVDSHVFSTVHRRKDGRDVPVEIVLEYPPAAAAGQPRMLVALVRDITERIEAEEALRSSEASLRLLEDRERLASDLHDLVIQRLFAAGMGLQAVHSEIGNERVQQRVTDTVSQIDQTIAELRTAIFHLTSPANERIADKIADTVDHAGDRLEFAPSLTIEGDPESIPTGIVEQLLPTLTEALSNIARHAQASTADVSLTVGKDTVTLSIVDDGVGIDPAAPRGSGLDNLAIRARKVGGTSALSANPDGGTALTWTARIS